MQINYLSQDSPDHNIIRESDFINSDGYPFSKCPCWGHKSNRTFIVTSPINYSFTSDNPDSEMLFWDDKHLNAPSPVFHMKLPHFLFWTHDSDVWLDVGDHPMTSLVNNLITVPGWLQLSTWPVKTSFSFVVVDKTKPVVLKKGDPIFRITFHSPDLNSNIDLNKIEEPFVIDEILDLYEMKREESMNDGSWVNRLFTKGKSKCPFARIIY